MDTADQVKVDNHNLTSLIMEAIEKGAEVEIYHPETAPKHIVTEMMLAIATFGALPTPMRIKDVDVFIFLDPRTGGLATYTVIDGAKGKPSDEIIMILEAITRCGNCAACVAKRERKEGAAERRALLN